MIVQDSDYLIDAGSDYVHRFSRRRSCSDDGLGPGRTPFGFSLALAWKRARDYPHPWRAREPGTSSNCLPRQSAAASGNSPLRDKDAVALMRHRPREVFAGVAASEDQNFEFFDVRYRPIRRGALMSGAP
jgi:hypothetical protein